LIAMILACLVLMAVVTLASNREAGRIVSIDESEQAAEARIRILERDGWTRVEIPKAKAAPVEPKDDIDKMPREELGEALKSAGIEFDEKATLSILRGMLRKHRQAAKEAPPEVDPKKE